MAKKKAASKKKTVKKKAAPKKTVKKKAAPKKTVKKKAAPKKTVKKKAAPKKTIKKKASAKTVAAVADASAPKKRTRRRRKQTIKKVFWVVYSSTMKPVARFEFYEKKEAEAKVEKLSKKSPHFLQKRKEEIEVEDS